MKRPYSPISQLGLVAAAFAIQVAPMHAQHVEDLALLEARLGLRAPPLGPSVAGFSDEGWALRAERAAATGEAITGILTVMLVPALFADSDDPLATDASLRSLFFTGPSAAGTLAEFFEEASGQRLTASGDVSPWYRTSVTLEAGTGGDTSVFGIGPDFGDYLMEAITAADQVLDFGQFDNDGPDGIPNSGDDNGTVDALAFLFAEAPRSCAGAGVWPHKSGLSPRNNGVPYSSNDLAPDGSPILADGYVIISASECDGSPLSSVAIVAHELGHELRLPDLYHPIGEGIESILSVNRRWVVGCFGLMAAGAWGCGPANEFPSFGPTHFSPWSRDRLGWISLVTVGDVRRREYVLDAVQGSQQVLEIPLDGEESLLAEYRPASGFDSDLPESGVLIYRHNLAGVFRPDPQQPSAQYRIHLLEADGDSGLVKIHAEGGNRGEAGDVFASNGSVAYLSNMTHPGTQLADGTPSSVTIHSITVAGGSARIVVSTARTPGIAGTTGLGSYDALDSLSFDLPVGGGALPYELAATVPNGSPVGLSYQLSHDRLLIAGRPLQTGQFDIDVVVRDERGITGSTTLTLTVLPITIPDSALMMGLIGLPTSTLTADERLLLDADGNGNGRYDVGDLRRYILER
ncbi:MAG: immune inhibitor A [Gemmatimonadota bacterium]|nr:MAG: immune inhibitor A [Gemmatimonadota bacterium]